MTILSAVVFKELKNKNTKVVFGGFFALRILLPSGQRFTQLFKVWKHRKSLCTDKEPYSVIVDDIISIIIITTCVITEVTAIPNLPSTKETGKISVLLTLRSGVFRHADRFNINHIH